jgi:transcriptional regulator with XRE-family HTH domain
MSDNTQLRDTFGANVRRLRLERGLSQAELAELAGIHRAYLSTVENGKRNVSIDNISRLARALSVEPPLLLTPHVAANDG